MPSLLRLLAAQADGLEPGVAIPAFVATSAKAEGQPLGDKSRQRATSLAATQLWFRLTVESLGHQTSRMTTLKLI